MDWQQVASLLIVGMTVLAFGWVQRPFRRARAACDPLCGCSSSGREAPQTMIFRGRKGARSQVIVKTD